MEHQLDEVEAGKVGWKTVLRDFYQDFHREMEDAEKALDGVRIKVPDEETDEVCELCGRKMVIKSGRFGRFFGLPRLPGVQNTKPLVERMPGRCPRCGEWDAQAQVKKGLCLLRLRARRGVRLYDVGCAHGTGLPSCGQTMFKKSGRGQMKPFCINESARTSCRRTSAAISAACRRPRRLPSRMPRRSPRLRRRPKSPPKRPKRRRPGRRPRPPRPQNCEDHEKSGGEKACRTQKTKTESEA